MSARVLSSQLSGMSGKRVRLEGWVHRVRDLGAVRFLLLRDRAGIAQVVVPAELDLGNIGCESVVRVDGDARRESRAPGGCEVAASRIDTIASAQPPPLEVFKPPAVARHRFETLLEHRAVSLRVPEVLDVFRVQAEILRSFRDFLRSRGFTEITTPKIVLAWAEGGSALFEVKYFHGAAYLNQSPQFYKQMMVGSGLERVFEVGHVYRAEKSETARHLTEYVSLDLEMGFIRDEQEVLRMVGDLLGAILRSVSERCGAELHRRGIMLPVFDEIPQVSFPEAREVLRDEFGKTAGIEGDLDTEGERLISQWAQREHGSELVFVTGYALDKRPMYTMPDEGQPGLSRSFDLLYRGTEIVTGGQRIHDHQQLVAAIRGAGSDPADYAGYLAAFRHGMPPHGGMGMGLERLTKEVMRLANIREACLFPRDRNRLTP